MRYRFHGRRRDDLGLKVEGVLERADAGGGRPRAILVSHWREGRGQRRQKGCAFRTEEGCWLEVGDVDGRGIWKRGLGVAVVVVAVKGQNECRALIVFCCEGGPGLWCLGVNARWTRRHVPYMHWTVTLWCRRRLVVVVFREEVDGEDGLQRCCLRSTVPCSALPTVPTAHRRSCSTNRGAVYRTVSYGITPEDGRLQTIFLATENN